MKTLLTLIALALLGAFLVLGSISDKRVPPGSLVRPGGLDPSGGPAFEVYVVKPRVNRPFAGLLPDGIFGLPSSELRFDHTGLGAEIRRVEEDRLELSGNGWELLIETDGEGRVAPGTRIVFPLELGGQQRILRCRPEALASAELIITTREDSDELDGSFLVEFASCEIAESQKAIEWPSAPLTVHGSFVGASSVSR